MKGYFLSILIIGSIGIGRKNLMAQSDFYAIDHIPEIKLYFEVDNWDQALDQLYAAGELGRLDANVKIDGILYEHVGVRYKGFSSYGSARNKNPFNIELDYTYKDQAHQGVSKIKLSNVIQDPSFVREVLSYEISRKYMPASRANYANVYVNDTLIGLYTNVEAVDKLFLENHFNSSDNTFFKCNPEVLDLNGENSNLSNSPGVNVGDYSELYKLKSDGDGGVELYDFIQNLNEDPATVDQVLNIDRTLWMHALNYTLINFDSYIGYAQNYYLYKDNNGRFNPILWDMNMSFGSFRLTDASDYWDGFTVAEAQTIDPLQHVTGFSVKPRPLITNVITDATRKKMYLAHIRTIVEENFDSNAYITRANYFQSLIDAHVLADTNKFYSYADFQNNIDSTVADLVDYPGIKELMEVRKNYLMNYVGVQGAPTIANVSTYPSETTVGDDVWITADLAAAPLNVYLAYRFDEDEVFQLVQMTDDGTQNDGGFGDGTYGAKIEGIPHHVQYYVYAENDSSGRFSPERAAYEFYELTSKLGQYNLVINEVMANNTSMLLNQDDEYESWIELYNNHGYSVTTEDLFLTNDTSDLYKWELPEWTIRSGKYLTIWADGDTAQTGLHTNFELDPAGDSLWLVHSDGTIIDVVYFGEQAATSSYGRYPNGTGNFREMLPSYRAENTAGDASLFVNDVFVYPNPANNEFAVRSNQLERAELRFFTLDGKQIGGTKTFEGQEKVNYDTSELANGIYLLYVNYNATEFIQKIAITH